MANITYDEQTWDTSSYVNPTRMNHIEQGIKAVTNIALKYTDITETTDSSGRIVLDTSVATTDNFISAIPLTLGSTFIKVAKRYNSESATAVWLHFVDNNNSAVGSTSVKFRVFYF